MKAKRALWEKIRQYNDEIDWPFAKAMSIKELEEYLETLEDYYKMEA